MITDIDQRLLEKIADLTGKPVGALNIRKDGGCEARQSTEHIKIDARTDGKQGIDIRRLNYFEELVRCIILKAADSGRRVKEGKPPFPTERHDLIKFKTLVFNVHEMVLITKEYLSLNAPVVVDEVGVVEVHAPPLALWRKAAQKQHPGMLGQKGNERMILDALTAPFDISRVQIFCITVLH